MDDWLVTMIEGHLAGLAYPATKDEVLDALDLAGAEAPARWLVQAVPGLVFGFAGDLRATLRIAMEMAIHEPWPEGAKALAGTPSDQMLAEAVTRRLAQCRRANGRLVKVTAVTGVVYLDGRAADVPQGVMATKVAAGVVPAQRIVNRLDVRA